MDTRLPPQASWEFSPLEGRRSGRSSAEAEHLESEEDWGGEEGQTDVLSGRNVTALEKVRETSHKKSDQLVCYLVSHFAINSRVINACHPGSLQCLIHDTLMALLSAKAQPTVLERLGSAGATLTRFCG